MKASLVVGSKTVRLTLTAPDGPMAGLTVPLALLSDDDLDAAAFALGSEVQDRERLAALDQRTKDREARDVEGTHKD